MAFDGKGFRALDDHELALARMERRFFDIEKTLSAWVAQQK
jgi:hypothetical protein